MVNRIIRVALTIILFAGILFGVVLNREKVTKIEVVDWGSEEKITEITDQSFIRQLVSELANTHRYSTGLIDFNRPDYKLIFLSNEEVVYELGYYKDIMKIDEGIIGRFWEFDRLYGVTLKLPIE